MGYGRYMMLAYNVVGCAPFGLMSADMVKDVWSHITAEVCPRRGPCEETLEFTTAKIYLQVIFGMACLYSAVIAIPGKNGLLGAMACMICTMSKHILVDGLIPPPPVMAMTAGVLCAILFAPEVWGKRAFIGFCLLNAFTFTTNPLMVLQDTFPGITEDSEAFKVGSFCFEVIALYLVMTAAVVMTPSSDLGLAYSAQLGATVMAKHVIIDKSGPPTPLCILFSAATIMSWYEYGWADLKPSCDKAIKAGPMKLHSLIVATGFIPYFALEAIGFSAPMLGMASIDSSYTYNGSTAMLMGMCAVLMSLMAYSEYKGQMEGKMFAMYHYFLSAVVLFWQFQPTTTTIGKLFFAAPHMFTLWTSYLVCTMTSAKKA